MPIVARLDRGGPRVLPGPLPAVVAGLLALTALASPRSADAHDLWLVPSSFRPAAGEPVAVRILVGHDPASADPLSHRPGWIESFVYAGGAEGRPTEGEITGTPGRDPAGWTRFERPGLYALGLVSAGTVHTMEVAGWRRYLAEEGLEAAARPRADAVYADGEVREAFSRSVKSLVRVARDGEGPPAAGRTGWDRPLGLPLELVPLADPFDPVARELRLRVLLHGEPASGVRVDLRPLDPAAPPEAAVHAVSDADGEVRLGLPSASDDPSGAEAAGLLASAVVLRRPPPESAAEWHSLWTSLTFERPAR